MFFGLTAVFVIGIFRYSKYFQEKEGVDISEIDTTVSGTQDEKENSDQKKIVYDDVVNLKKEEVVATTTSYQLKTTTVSTPLVNLGCNANVDSGTTVVGCGETQSEDTGPRSAGGNVVFPDHTSVIRFEYRFTGIEDGDYAAIAVDGRPVWVLSAKTAGITEEFQDGLTWVGDLSGNHFLGIILYPIGSPGVGFEVRNITLVNHAE